MKLGFDDVFNCAACITDFEATSLYSAYRCWANNDLAESLRFSCHHFHPSLRYTFSDDYDSTQLRYGKRLFRGRSSRAEGCGIDHYVNVRMHLSSFLESFVDWY